MNSNSRYIVGIDLGTTNSAVAFIDTQDGAAQVETFSIAQLTAPATVERLRTLPSFFYQPARGEFAAGDLALPWAEQGDRPLVGAFARDHGAEVPGRVVVSAKSWLCHSGIDRSAALLPWHGAGTVRRQSPGAVAACFLEHIRMAWDHQHPDAPLAGQNLVLTVPASFDEVARELTLEAAQRAGLPNLCLIEEPQAAFYAWMNAHPDAERGVLKPGQIVLVCDIGGGTTDLTLIRVEADEAGALSYRRIAVGEHLILGGDNLDLALAHHLEERAGGGNLSPAAWSMLVRRCQQAKEALLQPDGPQSYTINLPVRGRSVVGATQQIEVTRDEAIRVLADGFLPPVTLQDRPDTRHSGFQEFGLPYAPDAAITRYLIAFLIEHAEQAGHAASGVVRPDHILFNGGFFESPVLRDRLLAELNSALDTGDGREPGVLDNPHLDQAVAHGAVRYGMARRGEGVRISGGLPRAYYLGVGHTDTGLPPRAVCLLPAGLEEGASIALSAHTFKLLILQPVEFPLFSSSVRQNDRPGDLVAAGDAALRPMPAIKTVVQSGRRRSADSVEVQLHASLTEIGTIELWCEEVNGKRKWQLQFDVRAAAGSRSGGENVAVSAADAVDDGVIEAGRNVLNRVLGPEQRTAPSRLVKELEAATGMMRDTWTPSLLRTWFEELMTLESCRARDAETEGRWCNLLGYVMRPGYGFSIDDWRIQQLWKLFSGGVIHVRNEMCRAEWWILWRRVAGGLSDAQQRALATPLIGAWSARTRNVPGRKPTKMKEFQFGDHESAEVWRLLGSLERIRPAVKETLGILISQWIMRKGCRVSNGAAVWALGRVGARVPAYGPLNSVVSADAASTWIVRLMRESDGDEETSFALMQMSRLTGDRHRDVSDEVRKLVIEWMETHDAPPHHIELVQNGGVLDAGEQDRSFGEALPPGLHICG